MNGVKRSILPRTGVSVWFESIHGIMKTWLITKTDPTDIYSKRRVFWTGNGWSSEYPDAWLGSYRKAFDWCKRHRPAPFKIFASRHYGTDAEKAIEPNSGLGY